MPRTYRKRTTRRRPRRRRRVHRRKYIPKSVSGLTGHKMLRRKMRYVASKDLTATTGAIAISVFSANGLYDPDISGTGHQPRWFDQIMAAFNHYAVLGAKITCTFSHTTNDTPVHAIQCGIALTDVSSTRADWKEYCEPGRCSYKTLAPEGANDGTITLTKNFSSRKFFGKRFTIDNYDLKGNASSNPAEQAYFHVFMDPLGGTANDVIVAVITVDYIVQFSEPVDPAIS